MSYRKVHDVAVRLLRGEVIEGRDHRGRRWRATDEALIRTPSSDETDFVRVAEGAYDVAVMLCWWAVTDRISRRFVKGDRLAAPLSVPESPDSGQAAV